MKKITTKKEKLLWFYRLKNTLNKFEQITCKESKHSNIIIGVKDYNSIKVDFIIKLLPTAVLLKIRTKKGVQEHFYPHWACNAKLANDILFQVIVGGTHVPRRPSK